MPIFQAWATCGVCRFFFQLSVCYHFHAIENYDQNHQMTEASNISQQHSYPTPPD